MGIIDSRRVKTSHHADPSCKGVDGNKKVKGRKEHVVVDTLGLPMAIAVHEANLHDSKGAPKVIERLEHKFPRLTKILADGGYRGTLGDWVSEKFGWLENFRRLTIDHEYLADTAEAMVQLAFIQIMLNKFKIVSKYCFLK